MKFLNQNIKIVNFTGKANFNNRKKLTISTGYFMFIPSEHIQALQIFLNLS